MPSPELVYSSRRQPKQVTDRVMPQNIDAEKAVLAAMLFSPEVTEDALLKLNANEFYRPAHRIIFEAMGELYKRGIPVDSLSVVDRLKARGDLEAVGGKAYIIELGNNTLALDNWSAHADIVHREALLRDLIGASVRITSLGYDAPDNIDEVVEEAEHLLFNVTNKRVDTSFVKMDKLVTDTYNNLNALAESQSDCSGIRTGFLDLDNQLNGLRGGNLVIIAARPSVGKTSFALNMATRAAQLGTTVGFFSLEMSKEELVNRILSTETRISSQKFTTGKLSQNEWTKLINISGALTKLNLWIDDTPSASMLEVRTKARRLMRNVEPEKGMIIVDYLQLMQSGSNHYESRNVEVSEISRGLKMLAKELNMPVIALSQLSRAVEARENKRPMLSDLRESGSIEQDADIVMFIDRSTSEQEAENENRPPLGTANIIVAKHRSGPTGVVSLAFQSDFTRFDNLSHTNPADSGYYAPQDDGGSYPV
jgi:replicative DNA helicase